MTYTLILYAGPSLIIVEPYMAYMTNIVEVVDLLWELQDLLLHVGIIAGMYDKDGFSVKYRHIHQGYLIQNLVSGNFLEIEGTYLLDVML